MEEKKEGTGEKGRGEEGGGGGEKTWGGEGDKGEVGGS